MPTYEYKCAACGHAFEEFQSITAKPIRKCPECKKNKVDRLMGTGSAMIFKGSGFYITDYRSEGYKSAAKADTPGDATPAATPAPAASESGKKSDAAPAATPAPAPAASTPAPGPKSESKKSKSS